MLLGWGSFIVFLPELFFLYSFLTELLQLEKQCVATSHVKPPQTNTHTWIRNSNTQNAFLMPGDVLLKLPSYKQPLCNLSKVENCRDLASFRPPWRVSFPPVLFEPQRHHSLSFWYVKLMNINNVWIAQLGASNGLICFSCIIRNDKPGLIQTSE